MRVVYRAYHGVGTAAGLRHLSSTRVASGEFLPSQARLLLVQDQGHFPPHTL